MVFIRTVLAKTLGVKKSKGIQARLLSRMDHWTDDHIVALIKDTCGAGKSRGARARAISKRDKEDSVVMAYDRKIKGWPYTFSSPSSHRPRKKKSAARQQHRPQDGNTCPGLTEGEAPITIRSGHEPTRVISV